MTDAVRHLTAELASDGASLAFLDLAELLRQRRQFDAALTVSANGLARYPELADAHALRARILADSGDGERAFDNWMNALQLDPTHLGAHKGLGFLYYRAGDLSRALRHLQAAVSNGASEPGIAAAIARVESALAAEAAPPEVAAAAPAPAAIPPLPFSIDAADVPSDDDLFRGLEGARDGLLLLDQHGMRLGGGVRNDDGADVADAVAAQLAGVSREAARAARLLGLGSWVSVTAECARGNAHLVAPTATTILLTVRDASVPAGRLALLADRAAQVARRWLEGLA
ncbi:MAG: tetratricopeptide repeat protein [Gemmatimonadota bacterium]